MAAGMPLLLAVIVSECSNCEDGDGEATCSIGDDSGIWEVLFDCGNLRAVSESVRAK